MRDVAEIFDKILDCISDKSVSVHKIVCRTSLHVRTVKKYLALIEKLQSIPKIKREMKKITHISKKRTLVIFSNLINIIKKRVLTGGRKRFILKIFLTTELRMDSFAKII